MNDARLNELNAAARFLGDFADELLNHGQAGEGNDLLTQRDEVLRLAVTAVMVHGDEHGWCTSCDMPSWLPTSGDPLCWSCREQQDRAAQHRQDAAADRVSRTLWRELDAADAIDDEAEAAELDVFFC